MPNNATACTLVRLVDRGTDCAFSSVRTGMLRQRVDRYCTLYEKLHTLCEHAYRHTRVDCPTTLRSNHPLTHVVSYAVLGAGHTSTVWKCAFDGTGDRLCSVSDDLTLKVWQAYKPGNALGIKTNGLDPKWSCVATLSGTLMRRALRPRRCAQCLAQCLARCCTWCEHGI